MLWGKGLQQLCKRMAALIDEVRTDYPTATIVPLIYWNGNELVGKDGIEPSGTFPFDHPAGEASQLLADTKRHLAWTGFRGPQGLRMPWGHDRREKLSLRLLYDLGLLYD